MHLLAWEPSGVTVAGAEEMLKTPRMVLRDFTPADIDEVHAYASDTLVTRFTAFGPNTRKQSEEFVQRAIGAAVAEPRQDYTLAIELLGSSTVIGGCGLHSPNHGQWELGYVFAQRYWGMGLASELVPALVEFAFSQLGAQKVWAPVDAANIASARVLEKCGFMLEGLLRKDRLRWPDGRDTKLFGLLASDWTLQPSL
jgi:[ribosomal protein S5]-alanine N-acetyltransferase